MTARTRLLLPFSFFLGRLARAQPAAHRRPNVLLIAVDDLNTDIGCYGHPIVATPNIDRLSRRGTRFDRAYCQYPVCNPSRTSLLSGRYPEATRVLGNRTNPREHLGSVKFLPESFREQGYFTANIGKIYHDGMDGPRDWDHYLNPLTTAPAGQAGEGRNLTNGKFAFFHWRAAEGSDEDQPDGQTAAEAIRLLEQKRDKPFFLGVGFRKPHDGYVAPRRYFDAYPFDRIPPVEGPADDLADVPQAALPPVNHDLGRQEAREYRRAYYACISFMDAQVGKVLGALERLGLTGNTIVVLFGDNGLHLGEHGWWNKVTLFERSTRIPLIIAGPPVRQPGRASRRTVELLHLYPSLVEWAGLERPEGLEGVSLSPLTSEPEARWDRPAYSVVTRGPKLGRSIRTERFRYTEWDEGRLGAELYDHDTDPHEYRNLAGDPGYSAWISDLKRLLRAVRKS